MKISIGLLVVAILCGQPFTKEQANRGKTLYNKDCASCHGETLDGNGQAPPLTGADFRHNWEGQTAEDLLEKMQSSMPADQPGKLSREQNIDVLAFLFMSNGLPAGEKELSSDAEELRKIHFVAVASH